MRYVGVLRQRDDMNLYRINGGSFKSVEGDPIRLERGIKSLFENNSQELFK